VVFKEGARGRGSCALGWAGWVGRAGRWDGEGGVARTLRMGIPPEAVGLLRVPRRAAKASRPLRAAIPDAGFAEQSHPMLIQSPVFGLDTRPFRFKLCTSNRRSLDR